MTTRKQPAQRHTLFHEKKKQISHIVWHVATGSWPQKGEVIHHIDDDPFNNELGNLQLMTESEHNSFHNRGERNSNWLGDSAKKKARYMREYRAKRRNNTNE